MIYLNTEALAQFFRRFIKAGLRAKREMFELVHAVRVLQKSFRRHLAINRIETMTERQKNVMKMIGLKFAVKVRLRHRRRACKNLIENILVLRVKR